MHHRLISKKAASMQAVLLFNITIFLTCATFFCGGEKSFGGFDFFITFAVLNNNKEHYVKTHYRNRNYHWSIGIPIGQIREVLFFISRKRKCPAEMSGISYFIFGNVGNFFILGNICRQGCLSLQYAGFGAAVPSKKFA